MEDDQHPQRKQGRKQDDEESTRHYIFAPKGTEGSDLWFWEDLLNDEEQGREASSMHPVALMSDILKVYKSGGDTTPFKFENGKEAEKAEREVLFDYALSFDCIKYCEESGFDPFPASEWLKRNHSLPNDPLKCRALCFAIQRYFNEQGWLPHSLEARALRDLFIKTYQEGIPEIYTPDGSSMSREYCDRWQQKYQPDVVRWAFTVRFINGRMPYKENASLEDVLDLDKAYRPVVKSKDD